MIGNWYNQHPAKDMIQDRNTNTKPAIKVNATNEGSQKNSSFPVDDHHAIRKVDDKPKADKRC